MSESDCNLRYFDGESWVIVEDDDDLQLAFAIALSDTNKLTFSIKPSAEAPPALAPTAPSTNADDDEEMKEE